MYSLDTSAILNPWWKFYPPDMFRSLWDWFDGLIERQCVFASEEVLVELERKDDEVYQWALARQVMFVPTDEDIQAEVTKILSCYQRLVDNRRNRSGADPFVIALAPVKATQSLPMKTEVEIPINLISQTSVMGWESGPSVFWSLLGSKDG
jgi:hypothetical protein